MITQIGIVGGEILNFLDEHGIVELEKITTGIDKPEKLILMSLGWLARENLIVVTQEKSKYLVESKKKTEKIKK